MLKNLRRHDIWISENLKFDYLNNEKSFRSEIKKKFLVSQVLFFRHTKQTLAKCSRYKYIINLFIPNAPFLYPLKTSENLVLLHWE